MYQQMIEIDTYDTYEFIYSINLVLVISNYIFVAAVAYMNISLGIYIDYVYDQSYFSHIS